MDQRLVDAGVKLMEKAVEILEYGLNKARELDRKEGKSPASSGTPPGMPKGTQTR